MAEVAVALGSQRDDLAAPGLHFRHVRDNLLIDVVRRGDEHHRHLVVDQCDRTMLHLGGRVSLRVNVADLLELERSLKGDGEVDTPAEIQGVPAVHIFQRYRLDFLLQRQRSADQLREPGEGANHFPALLERKPAVPPHIKPQEGQRHDLRDERLG